MEQTPNIDGKGDNACYTLYPGVAGDTASHVEHMKQGSEAVFQLTQRQVDQQTMCATHRHTACRLYACQQECNKSAKLETWTHQLMGDHISLSYLMKIIRQEVRDFVIGWIVEKECFLNQGGARGQ